MRKQFDKEIRRKQLRAASGHASSAPEFLGRLASGAGVRAPAAGGFPPPLSPLRSFTTPGAVLQNKRLEYTHARKGGLVLCVLYVASHSTRWGEEERESMQLVVLGNKLVCFAGANAH